MYLGETLMCLAKTFIGLPEIWSVRTEISLLIPLIRSRARPCENTGETSLVAGRRGYAKVDSAPVLSCRRRFPLLYSLQRLKIPFSKRSHIFDSFWTTVNSASLPYRPPGHTPASPVEKAGPQIHHNYPPL